MADLERCFFGCDKGQGGRGGVLEVEGQGCDAAGGARAVPFSFFEGLFWLCWAERDKDVGGMRSERKTGRDVPRWGGSCGLIRTADVCETPAFHF